MSPTDRQTDGWIGRQPDKDWQSQTDRSADSRECRQMLIWKDRQMNKQPVRHTEGTVDFTILQMFTVSSCPASWLPLASCHDVVSLPFPIHHPTFHQSIHCSPQVTSKDMYLSLTSTNGSIFKHNLIHSILTIHNPITTRNPITEVQLQLYMVAKKHTGLFFVYRLLASLSWNAWQILVIFSASSLRSVLDFALSIDREGMLGVSVQWNHRLQGSFNCNTVLSFYSQKRRWPLPDCW